REHGAMDVQAVHPLPAELRQQRGMRVEDAPVKGAERSRADLTHVAGQDDDLGPAVDERHGDRGIEGVGIWMRATRKMMEGRSFMRSEHGDPHALSPR